MSGLRVDTSSTDTRCWRTDHNVARLIRAAREEAHDKHGDHSIESIPAYSIGTWLAVLMEEVGEVAHSLTYDADGPRLADELLDVLAVAAAWLDALRLEGAYPRRPGGVWLA